VIDYFRSLFNRIYTCFNEASDAVTGDDTAWFWDREIYDYFHKVIEPKFPHLFFVGSRQTTDEISDRVIESFKWAAEREPIPTALAYLMHVSKNHWAITYIDLNKRTIEYYDSKKTYGEYRQIVETLTELAKKLSAKEPGKQPYTFQAKITKVLQPDSYQCGPWALYFLEKRAEDPDVDFNALDVNEAQKMIADYRKQIRLIVPKK
jgi:hypothetical protein